MNRTTVRGLFLFVAAALIINYLSVEASAEKKIGVLMFSEQGRYRECLQGMMEQLAKDGYREPAVSFTMDNARDSKAKMAELVQKFAGEKMDLIIAIGTPAAIAVSGEIREVPIVFSMVYDPVEAGIAKGWKSSGNNTTGSTTKLPMSAVVKRLREFAPVKRVAVLYTPGQKNSEIQLMELQKALEDSGIRTVPVILASREEVAQTVAEVARTVDALYLTGSTVVGATVPAIVDAANKERVVTLSHLDDMVEKGALLGICPDSYLVGRLAGKKAAKVLKGAKPSSIPIEPAEQLNIILNMKTAKEGKFQIPQSFMGSVTKVVR